MHVLGKKEEELTGESKAAGYGCEEQRGAVGKKNEGGENLIARS